MDPSVSIPSNTPSTLDRPAVQPQLRRSSPHNIVVQPPTGEPT